MFTPNPFKCMKKIALFSLISLIFAATLVTDQTPVLAAETTNNSNIVSVYSCTQTGRNIKIRRTSTQPEYVLNSSCRDAGHGMREYALTCTSAKQYRVEWKPCGNTAKPTITANVTYTAVWYQNESVQKVVPTVTARATDTDKITKINLYHNLSQVNGVYTILKTCTTNATTATCAHKFSEPARGNFYAVAWDEAGNSVTSTKFTY